MGRSSGKRDRTRNVCRQHGHLSQCLCRCHVYRLRSGLPPHIGQSASGHARGCYRKHNLNLTTPKSITQEIIALCSQLDPFTTPVFVPVKPAVGVRRRTLPYRCPALCRGKWRANSVWLGYLGMPIGRIGSRISRMLGKPARLSRLAVT